MSKRQYGIVVAGSSGSIDNNTATKNFDSREFTFKYIDRKKYGDGVLAIERSATQFSYPYPTYVIKHGLGYIPSYRFYLYVRDADNDYAKNNNQYEMQQANGSASVVNCGAYIGKESMYIYVKRSSSQVAGSLIYFTFLIGADDLDADADETRYIS